MKKRRYLEIISWDKVHKDVFLLAENIYESDFKPEIIIGIGYGGIIPATLLYFALPETEFKILYPSKYAKFDMDNIMEIKDKKVLLADDLAITGDSLQDVREHIHKLGAKEVKTACLYCSMDYERADFFIRKLPPNELIVFPWYTLPKPEGISVFEYRNRFGKHEPAE